MNNYVPCIAITKNPCPSVTQCPCIWKRQNKLPPSGSFCKKRQKIAKKPLGFRVYWNPKGFCGFLAVDPGRERQKKSQPGAVSWAWRKIWFCGTEREIKWYIAFVDMIYGVAVWYICVRKYDIISVPSYAEGIYHRSQSDIISKIYHPFVPRNGYHCKKGD